MRPKLLNLLASNAKKGSFRAEDDTIFLYDVIVGSDAEAEFWGGVSPEAFSRQLAGMSGTVHLRINSPGGDVFASRAMAQAMREYQGEIIAHVDGYAASAASLIAVSADRCIMAPGSFLMIHKAWTMALGNSEEFLATAGLLEKIDGTLAETYAEKSGKDAARFAEMMAAETWFTAAEAVDLGLADEAATAKPKNAARWDLSAYQAAPAVEPDPEPEPAPAPEPLAAPAASDNERRARVHAVRMLCPTA
jgi:ATP-dependent protease ClpP protease subunit